MSAPSDIDTDQGEAIELSQPAPVDIDDAQTVAQSIVSDAVYAAAVVREAADRYRVEQEALADARRGEADAEAETIEAAAKERLDLAIAEADRIMKGGEAFAAAQLQKAKECSEEILENVRVRLQRLLDAEAEVHIRLAAALSNTRTPLGGPLERDDERLLDIAFAEFFSSEIEHDESRAWILSDHAN